MFTAHGATLARARRSGKSKSRPITGGFNMPMTITEVVQAARDEIEVNGSGDITQLIHRARTTLGLPIPKGTPHPSKLEAFQPDIGRHAALR
jgi:hypothetical protein